MCIMESCDKYADSEWSERTDVLSELSEEDVMDALSLITMPSMSSLGPSWPPSSIEGEQGTPCLLYSSGQSGDESSPR